MPVRDSLKLNALRAQVKAGADALESGDFIEVDDADLEIYLERLTTPPSKHART
jgi:antitoxin ParD1/3/4